MSKLNQEELLGWLDKCWSLYKTSQDEWKLSEQAYQQIREMIQKLGTIFNCPSCGRLWDSKIHNACQCGAIIQKKPGITEEWIEKTISELFVKHSIGFPTPKMIVILKDFIHLLEKLYRSN